MANKKRIGILIACRMKSSRLPRKALLKIVGKPMIEHLIERVKCSKLADEIILCTSTNPDDAILSESAQKCGIHFFTGDEIDVMGRFINAAEKYNLEVVVRVTGDNPLTDFKHIDKLIESHLKENADFSKVENLPLGTNCEVISLSTLKKAHEMAEDPGLTEYMTSYLKQPKYFKINLLKVDQYLNHPEIRLTVDQKEDIELMEEIYKRLYKEGEIFELKEVISLLTEKEPYLLGINKKVPERALPKILMKGDPLASKPKIVLFGARMDGHAGVVLDIIEKFSMYNVVGFIDDNVAIHNTTIQGIPVLGGVNDFLHKLPSSVEGFFICSGDNEFRKKCFSLLKRHNLKLVNVVHPSSQISSKVQIGEGVFIGPQVVVMHNVIVGNGVILNTGATIDHDNKIEDFVNISPGCHTSGRVTIQEGSFLGTGTTIIPDIVIGRKAYLGAGSVVIKNVFEHSKVAGVPAKEIRNKKGI